MGLHLSTGGIVIILRIIGRTITATVEPTFASSADSAPPVMITNQGLSIAEESLGRRRLVLPQSNVFYNLLSHAPVSRLSHINARVRTAFDKDSDYRYCFESSSIFRRNLKLCEPIAQFQGKR